jgi:hypothetical protein
MPSYPQALKMCHTPQTSNIDAKPFFFQRVVTAEEMTHEQA